MAEAAGGEWCAGRSSALTPGVADRRRSGGVRRIERFDHQVRHRDIERGTECGQRTEEPKLDIAGAAKYQRYEERGHWVVGIGVGDAGIAAELLLELE